GAALLLNSALYLFQGEIRVVCAMWAAIAICASGSLLVYWLSRKMGFGFNFFYYLGLWVFGTLGLWAAFSINPIGGTSIETLLFSSLYSIFTLLIILLIGKLSKKNKG
ncbi:MAG: hypothetical protein JW963_14020, partial [Anaerolineales bacterium]|nr:hypothetical protein [Anaerolineales bacterium]